MFRGSSLSLSFCTPATSWPPTMTPPTPSNDFSTQEPRASAVRDPRPRSDSMMAASPLRSFLTPATLGTSWPGGAALDLLETAGVRTSQHQLAQVGNRSILILRRFDRTRDGGRIGYISAMTATGSSDGDQKDYADLAEQFAISHARPSKTSTVLRPNHREHRPRQH